jgi:hypothetical protein
MGHELEQLKYTGQQYIGCCTKLSFHECHLLTRCACRYVDHFMYKGHLCIVTDYCEAGDLYR